MDRFDVTNALRKLETSYGRSPSVQEVADSLEVSSATVWRYLQEAVDKGLVVKRDGRYMTLDVAKAYKQKE